MPVTSVQTTHVTSEMWPHKHQDLKSDCDHNGILKYLGKGEENIFKSF